jgi:hypothetical protein
MLSAMSALRVYVETSVFSYLAARPSRDLLVAGHQQVTRDWWEPRHRFELFVSDAVLEEAARGDASVARERLALVENAGVIAAIPAAQSLAKAFLSSLALPHKFTRTRLGLSRDRRHANRDSCRSGCPQSGFDLGGPGRHRSRHVRLHAERRFRCIAAPCADPQRAQVGGAGLCKGDSSTVFESRPRARRCPFEVSVRHPRTAQGAVERLHLRPPPAR